jgi:hypothetical protein
MKKQLKSLINRKYKLLTQLGRDMPFIEGSLSISQRECASEGCICHRGKKHQSMALTWKEDQKTKSLYVPAEKQKQALAWSKNYKKIKALIRNLSEVNKQILTAKDQL